MNDSPGTSQERKITYKQHQPGSPLGLGGEVPLPRARLLARARSAQPAPSADSPALRRGTAGSQRPRRNNNNNSLLLQMIFNADEAHNIVKECIENVLGKADYNHNKVNQWTAAIVEQSLTHLVKLGKTYKYIVTCAVMQRSGAGLHTASSCFWDTTTDGTCTVRWENRTMNCIVNVFAVAIIL
ncbi:dynein light chain Tctex-type 3 [Geospiza fortis]|uniref:Dynein light chain Tctex-type 3 n=30 Tax=Neognathae TaxID=8825 RepID=A0A6I9HND0_GEOFO|nr:dynein light chain Tctex-type 3 [Geospiza fortis]